METVKNKHIEGSFELLRAADFKSILPFILLIVLVFYNLDEDFKRWG